MRGIVFECGRVDPATLQAMLDALTLIDLAQWRAAGGLKPLREAGVRYQREPLIAPGIRQELWLCSNVLRRKRRGDCEDLACDKAAQYQFKGVLARAMPFRSPTGFHIKVRLPGGRILDPSRALGMGK